MQQYSFRQQLRFTTMLWREDDAPAILVISPRPHLAPPEARRISDRRAQQRYAASPRFRRMFSQAISLCRTMMGQGLLMALKQATTQQERDRAVENGHRAETQFCRYIMRIRGIKQRPF